jgi:DivIVA domain-containing protein
MLLRHGRTIEAMSAPDRDVEPRAVNLEPDAIARTTFPTSFRGYDADHVRTFLDQIAGELRAARTREAELRIQLDAVESKLAAAGQLDEDQLTAALGEETARVLTVAREAASGIKSKASETAAQTMRDAEEQADVVRRDADAVMERRTEEADAEAARIRADVEASVEGLQADAERALEAARVQAERIRLEAQEAGAVEVEAARARGREMVDEALLVRSRVLEDLARKRKASRVQLERLQAGRERLIDSYSIVQRTLDEAKEELRTSLTSAKIAADDAARRVEAEPLPTPSELERQIEIGHQASVDDATVTSTAPSARPGTSAHDEMVPMVPPADYEAVRIVEAPDAPETTEVVEIVEVGEVVEIVEADEDADDSNVDVDELFARIRASRDPDLVDDQDSVAASEVAESEAPADPDEVVAVEAAEAAEVDAAEPPTASEPPAASESEPETEAEPVGPDDQDLLERRDAITDAVEKQAVRKLKRVLADEQNEVLDRLRRNPKSHLDDLFPAAGEHSDRYASVVRSDLVNVARSGGSFYGAKPAKTDVGDLAGQLGEALTFPLRDRIEGSLREAAGDEDAMADGVRAVYRDWKTHRIESHTRDTVLAAFNRGLFDATEPENRMRWVVDNGGSPCPDAEDNSLAGLVVRGESFPTGHCYPPAHPGCRCLLVAERQ